MNLKFTSDKKIAETSSKGNQEKWFDADTNMWYKLDQFGYEALSEALISRLLESSNIEQNTPFTFVRYDVVKMNVHGRTRTGCSSVNFLKEGQSIITLSHLFKRIIDVPLSEKLGRLSSDIKRIAYLAEATAGYTKLEDFPKYLALLFEVDALFLNDDRHLNNIALLEENGKFDYCPIFDNGAGLLSNVQLSPMDIDPKALIPQALARPFNISFNRQRNNVRKLYGSQLAMPKLTANDIAEKAVPLLEFYPERDRGLILDRVTECILKGQN